MHVLMHVPARHRPHFDDLVVGWWPAPGEVDVTSEPAHAAEQIRELGTLS